MKTEAFMIFKYIASLSILTLWLAACAGPISTEPGGLTGYPAASQPTSSLSTPYPEPVEIVPEPTTSAYPAPGMYWMGTSADPSSSYEPQPGDQNLKRDQVMLELESSQIYLTATAPSQVNAILHGNLSDPCHQLRVVVTTADAHNTINLEVYSLVDPNVACIMVIKPFTATVPLGSYSSGQYAVMVNGEKLGEFGDGYPAYP